MGAHCMCTKSCNPQLFMITTGYYMNLLLQYVVSAKQLLSFLRGKSGLHRARCQVTPGGRKSTESATENRPPASVGKGEKVR